MMEMINFQTLALISILTTLTTECIKTFCKRAEVPYISNIIAAVSSVILSAVITIAYPVIVTGSVIDGTMIFNTVVMAFFGVLTATLGYDKVVQALKQLEG